MLAAAVLGLILPSVEYGGKYGLITTVLGIFAGALALNLIDNIVPPANANAKGKIAVERLTAK